jgi:hypothetical protein
MIIQIDKIWKCDIKSGEIISCFNLNHLWENF